VAASRADLQVNLAKIAFHSDRSLVEQILKICCRTPSSTPVKARALRACTTAILVSIEVLDTVSAFRGISCATSMTSSIRSGPDNSSREGTDLV